MEISGSSLSLGHANLSLVRPVESGSRPTERAGESHELRHDHHHGRKRGHGTALHAFRQELRIALKAQFRVEVGTGHGAYLANQEPTAPDDVADEALGVAKQVVAQSPTTASRSLIQFRSRVEESVNMVRQTVSDQDDMTEVDQAVARVDGGLSEMEEQAAATKAASSSVLEVDMRTKQRSKISIRTQEGDIVKLSLKQVSEFSASSSQSIEGKSASSETEIEFSSRSRMVMKVRGDLSEAELGAIEGVLGQAQQMADAFFGGDIGAAFESAGGFQFDNEQLANVNMRFRMGQVSNISYSETVVPAALVEKPTPAVDAAVTQPVMPAATPEVAPAIEAAPAVAAQAPVADDAIGVETAVDDAPAAAIPRDAISGFFEMVGNFLRSVSEGFEGESGNAIINYQYSESFKLSLLQSVIHAVAPDDASVAADLAVDALGQMNEVESE